MTINNSLGNLVISARSLDQAVSWQSLWDFVDLIARQDGFDALDLQTRREFDICPPRLRPTLAKMGRKYEASRELPNKINMTIVACRNPDDLLIINSLPEIRDRSNIVAAYVLDSYFREGYPKIAPNYDIIFVSDEDDVDFVRDRYNCEVQCIWQGIDTQRWASLNDNRSIDLVGFGRVPVRYHRAFQKSYHQSESDVFYLHSPIGHPSGPEVGIERGMFFKTLQHSKISLAFHLMFEPEGVRPRSMMLTARWLESLISGCLILGKAPTSRSAAGILNWENSTIEIADDQNSAIDQIRDIVKDSAMLKKQRAANIEHMTKHHDWRNRLRMIFSATGIDEGKIT